MYVSTCARLRAVFPHRHRSTDQPTHTPKPHTKKNSAATTSAAPAAPMVSLQALPLPPADATAPQPAVEWWDEPFLPKAQRAELAKVIDLFWVFDIYICMYMCVCACVCLFVRFIPEYVRPLFVRAAALTHNTRLQQTCIGPGRLRARGADERQDAHLRPAPRAAQGYVCPHERGRLVHLGCLCRCLCASALADGACLPSFLPARN